MRTHFMQDYLGHRIFSTPSDTRRPIRRGLNSSGGQDTRPTSGVFMSWLAAIPHLPLCGVRPFGRWLPFMFCSVRPVVIPAVQWGVWTECNRSFIVTSSGKYDTHL